MRVRLQRLLEELRSSYWFVPALMTATTVLLVLAVRAGSDAFRAAGVPGLAWLSAIGAEGARAVLATVATSSIGAASVVFSIAIVALSLTSSQFGPRLLKNFMKHGATQVTLGTFIATFLFSLLCLAMVPAEAAGGPPPDLAVLVGLGLGLASFGMLIFFVQHIASFIQAPTVIEDVSANLIRAFERLPLLSEGNEGEPAARSSASDGAPVTTPVSGYLQAIDAAGLTDLAVRRDLQLQLRLRPGHFAVRGETIAVAEPRARVDPEVEEAICSCFVFGAERTPTQDLEFPVDQLVEIAVRALSSGTNDPFTAINCIDQLGAALALLSARRLPDGVCSAGDGRARVVMPPFTYAGILDTAFHQLRQHATTDAAVTIRLLDVMGSLAERELPEAFRRSLLRHAELVRSGREHLEHPSDREDVEQRFRRIEEALGRG